MFVKYRSWCSLTPTVTALNRNESDFWLTSPEVRATMSIMIGTHPLSFCQYHSEEWDESSAFFHLLVIHYPWIRLNYQTRHSTGSMHTQTPLRSVLLIRDPLRETVRLRDFVDKTAGHYAVLCAQYVYGKNDLDKMTPAKHHDSGISSSLAFWFHLSRVFHQSETEDGLSIPLWIECSP